MKRILQWAAALLAIAFLVAACGTIPGVSRQGVAGITDVTVEWCKPPDESDRMYLCGLRWQDGKQKTNITLTIALPADGGSLTYSATGVLAFEGQAIRAAVETAISADIKEAVPNIVDIIVDGLTGPLSVLR